MNSRAILADLIAFDTTSRESNLALIEYIERYLQSFGLQSTLINSADGRKANLHARLGPAGAGGIMLSGHSDVVPADGQHWSVPAFTLTSQNGKLYGRGTADMKGYLACVLAAVPKLLAAPLNMPVHIAISYDEEVGCLGVRSLIEQLKASPERPAICLIGEPTNMQPVLGHKGKLAMRCHVHGAACHSAYAPQGVNAIEYAAKLINHLGELGDALADSKNHDARFDPPFSTVQTGVIQGGRALNIVPAECQFDFEMRSLPADDPNQLAASIQRYAEDVLLPKMRAVSESADIRFSELSSYPGLLTDAKSEAATLLAHLCGRDDFTTVAFGTEGGLFDEAGIATVVCGPGSMEQGHKPDEFVSCEQLEKCEQMLEKLAKWLQA